MKSIHKNLVFDHLYFATNEAQFEEIKHIFLRFTCASHQVVKTDSDSWEGVYVKTRGQHYLEILKDRRVNGMGLCQKAFAPLSQDARNIVYDFPDLPWQTFERSMDGQKWYTALSCDDYFDLQTPFNTWVMDYHQRDAQTIMPLSRFEISRLCEVKFSANPELAEKIKLNSTWFNSENIFSEHEVEFAIQTYYSDPFGLKITFDNQNKGFAFKEATMKMNDGFIAEDLRLKFFDFYRNGETYVLKKK